MQYKVPQNVGIEDRIVGPLTLRQLIILSAGCGFSYILFTVTSKLYDLNVIEYMVILLPAIFATLAALVKINDITFTKFILLFLEFNIKPKRRFWDHRGIAEWIDPDFGPAPEKSIETSPFDKSDKKSQIDLEGLSRMLDSKGFQGETSPQHQDMDDARDDYLVQQAFFGKPRDDKTANMYWRCKNTHDARLTALAKTPPTALKKEEKIQQKSIPTMPFSPAKASIHTKLPHKNPKPSAQNRGPVREKKQINTLNKNKPIHYVSTQPKPVSTQQKNILLADQKTTPSNPVKSSLLGEISFSELQKGEIEINLD